MIEQKLLNRFAFLHSLSTVTRYSRDDVLVPESVLSHLGWVAIFAALMAEDVLYFNAEVSVTKVILRAAFHDIEESVVADVARPTKYSSNAMSELFKKLENKAARSVSDSIGSNAAYHLWVDAKDDSIEGLIVTMADASAVVYKIWYEVAKLGNLSFIRVAEEIRDEALSFNEFDRRWPLLGRWRLKQLELNYFETLLASLRHVVVQCIEQGTPLTANSTMRIKLNGND